MARTCGACGEVIHPTADRGGGDELCPACGEAVQVPPGPTGAGCGSSRLSHEALELLQLAGDVEAETRTVRALGGLGLVALGAIKLILPDDGQSDVAQVCAAACVITGSWVWCAPSFRSAVAAGAASLSLGALDLARCFSDWIGVKAVMLAVGGLLVAGLLFRHAVRYSRALAASPSADIVEAAAALAADAGKANPAEVDNAVEFLEDGVFLWRGLLHDAMAVFVTTEGPENVLFLDRADVKVSVVEPDSKSHWLKSSLRLRDQTLKGEITRQSYERLQAWLAE